MSKKSPTSEFIPYVPNPLDANYIFTKDDDTDMLIHGILGNADSPQSVCEMWYDYFEMHLPFPFKAFVVCPLKIKNGNTITSCRLPLTIVELAPLNRCSYTNMVFVGTKERDDFGRYFFLQDIRRVVENEPVDQILFPYLYWKYFEGKRET